MPAAHHDYNKRLAVLAEHNGFEYALSQVRYMASYGAAYQQESTRFSLALLLVTERLKVIAAVHPGLWHPAVLAKLLTTADHLSGGRAEEFIRVLRAGWSEDSAEFAGDFYRLRGYDLKPKPLHQPEIFQGGNSTAARAMAGRVSDWYFSNGKDFDGVTEQIDEVGRTAREHGRTVRFGLNTFLIARDTEPEAKETLREIVAKADVDAVHGFRDAVRQAGSSTSDKRGMWSDSEFEDLVQYNDGFRSKLIGTPEQIAHRIVEYKRRGVNLLLLGFLHYLEEVEYFGTHVLPIVRELEAELVPGAGTPEPVGGLRCPPPRTGSSARSPPATARSAS
ncbi:LLM class flavin-dependent oxidoreductase [Amycolatopsis lurida]